VVVTSVRDEAGRIRGFFMVSRDLSEQWRTSVRVRESEERFRLLVENVQDYGIFMLDPLGRVVTWNAGAERIKGYRASEIIGQHFSRFYPDEAIRAGVCEAELATADRDGRFEDEGWRIRKDGSMFWANVTITALRDRIGELRGFAKVTRDLTARMSAESERRRLAQAEEAIRLRDEFLSIASHELKTPLTALQLQLQSLRVRVAGLDEKLKVKIERAAQSSTKLADLVESLLDASHLASGHFTLCRQRFDIGEAARGLVERLRLTADSAGCEMAVLGDEHAIGVWDPIRLEQALTNLLANAMKYGAGRPVRIIMTSADDDLSLEVRDHGPGLAEKDLSRIFERFERAASARNYGGLGLGLYITRQIVEAHGGTVTARNVPEGGASFVIRLPLEPAGGEPALQ
jgi:PAS domain S-box-containing protein